MNKIINIDGRDVKLKVNGSFLLRYKMKYKRDAFKDIIELVDGIKLNDLSDNNKENLDLEFKLAKNLDLDLFFRLLHMMAKTGNPDITDDVIEWCSSFDNLPIFNLLQDIIELLVSSIYGESQKKN